MNDAKQMIEKIQKLLRLAENEAATEAEARLAAERASELMLRYKLSMQEIAGHDDSPEEDVIDQTVEQKTTRMQDKFIYGILAGFFFVNIVRTRGNGMTWHIMGRETDVEIAVYVRGFLFKKFPQLFLIWKRQTSASEGDRMSYYLGLSEGLSEQLRAQRASVEKEMALVVVEDQAVKRYVAQKFPSLKSMGETINLRSEMAQAAGRQQGRDLRINKAVGGGGYAKQQMIT